VEENDRVEDMEGASPSFLFAVVIYLRPVDLALNLGVQHMFIDYVGGMRRRGSGRMIGTRWILCCEQWFGIWDLGFDHWPAGSP
jgi:hypothetical protein